MNTKQETVKSGSTRQGQSLLIAMRAILALLLVVLPGCTGSGGSVLTLPLSEPLGGATSVKIEIDPGDGNLVVDHFINNEQELASGTLQYLENQSQPTHIMDTSSEPAIFTLKASSGERPWNGLPWAACNGATEWQVHLNPQVTSELTAHTDGGNVKLNLIDMGLTYLMADTSGGNIEVALPDKAANLSATVKTGAGDVSVEIGSGISGSNTLNASSSAGNVEVQLPERIAARIHITSGMGKTMVDSRFTKVDDVTYQSPDYDSADDRVEITVSSSAGNVMIISN